MTCFVCVCICATAMRILVNDYFLDMHHHKKKNYRIMLNEPTISFCLCMLLLILCCIHTIILGGGGREISVHPSLCMQPCYYNAE